MKSAYLILAHTELNQLVDLVNTLNCNEASFFIHLDAKVQIPISLNKFFKRENVVLIQNRVRVYWGGFSQIEATFRLLESAYSFHRNQRECYFHLISGLDFPIKSNYFINNWFNENYGIQFIEYNQLPYSNWVNNGGIDRVKYYWFIDGIDSKVYSKFYLLQKQLNITNKYYSDKAFYFGGSQWWSITKECVKYLLDVVDDGALLEEFRYTYSPDELFFQCCIIRSQKFITVNNNLRYIDWKTGPQYPKILDITDWTKIQCSNRLFARKFTAPQSFDLRDLCKRHLGDRGDSPL